MHRLEDMRIVEDVWAMTIYVCEVDEQGQPTNVVQGATLDNAIPQSARPMFRQLYRCDACDQEFHSWEEAKAHIDFGR